MKRADGLYDLISEPENLGLAFEKAARGKRTRKDVIEFSLNLEVNLRKIRDNLLECRPDIGHYRFFRVRDPKQRTICAASFPERVLHHAVMNVCEPYLERYAIYDSYACRKGKGVHRALRRAQKFSRQYAWYLKLDIRKYFDSIDHDITIRLLCRRFKDADLLILFMNILESYHTEPGKGVPIGNLISQHLANFYLGLFDHWIKEIGKIRGYLRYMDDFIVFGNEKDSLKQELGRIERFLKEELALELKNNIQLNRSDFGIPFLGFRVFPSAIRLTHRSKNRFARKFREFERKWAEGDWTDTELVRHMEPLVAHTRIADAAGFRRFIINRFGVPY